MIKINNNKLFILILIILGAVVPWHWFADGRIIAGGDHLFYYNPVGAFYESWFTWIDRINFGEPNYAVAFIFPFLSFFKFFQTIGFTQLNANVFWAVFLFLTPGLFMFLLVRDLLAKELRGSFGAFIAALFYMFNPYIMTDMFQVSQRPVQIVLPLLLLLWYRGLRSPNKQLLYSILFALATLLTASTGTAPAFMAIIPLALFLFTIFWLLFHRATFKKTPFFVLGTTIFSVLVNLWWLFPALLAYRESGAALQKTLTAGNYTTSTTIWEALRLFGFWAFRIDWNPTTPHIPYAQNYYQAPFLLLSYLLTALGLSGLLLKPRRAILIFFAFLFLFAVFLSKGSNIPFGDYYAFLFKNFPPFSMFREPYSKITSLSLFSLAVLLGLSWNKILQLLSNRQGLLLSSFLSLSILLYSFPIVIGLVIQSPAWHKITRDSLRVEIPPAWSELGRWLEKNDPGGRIMLFPKSGYGVCYKWILGTCAGQPIARLFLPNQTIRFVAADELPRDRVIYGLFDLFNRGTLYDISSALKFLGIRYVLQQNDLDWQHAMIDTVSPSEAQTILNTPEGGLSKIKTVGALDLYSYMGSENIQPIFVTSNLNFVSGNHEDLKSLIALRGYKGPEAFYFTGDSSYHGNKFLDLAASTSNQFVVLPKEVRLWPEESRFTAYFPKDGVYSVYFRSGPTSENDSVTEETIVLGDIASYRISGTEIRDSIKSPLKLGEVVLKEGNYMLSESVAFPVNYLQYVATTGRLDTVSLAPGRYLLSFDYHLPPEIMASLTINEVRCRLDRGDADENKDGACDQPSLVGEELLTSNNEINRYQKEFSVFAPKRDINLVFKTSRSPETGQSLLLNNFNLQRLLENNVYFVKELQPEASFPSSPAISFISKNPTLYEINVKSATKPYFLSFLETNNRNWKVKINGNTLDEQRRFLLDGFANGWFIKPEDSGGLTDYTIYLEYQNQRLFYFGLGISSVSILVLVGYLVKKRLYG